ncbi:MAG: ABC transporter permease, partial [Gammaproteobacteria bacterium]
LGKFLGIYLFFLILLTMLLAMPLSLYAGATLDAGKLAATAVGLMLLLAAFTAIGVFMSSLTEQPVIAAISTFGVLLLLWIIDWSGTEREDVSGLFSYLSIQTHLESFMQGLLNSTDVMYYLIIVVTFLILSIRRLDNQRLTG